MTTAESRAVALRQMLHRRDVGLLDPLALITYVEREIAEAVSLERRAWLAMVLEIAGDDGPVRPSCCGGA